MGVRNTEKCEFCNEKDYIEHFFWFCSKIHVIWKCAVNFIYILTGKQFTLTCCDVLFGFKVDQLNNSDIRIANKIILVAKMCISKYKYGNRLNIISIFERELMLRNIINHV